MLSYIAEFVNYGEEIGAIFVHLSNIYLYIIILFPIRSQVFPVFLCYFDFFVCY